LRLRSEKGEQPLDKYIRYRDHPEQWEKEMIKRTDVMDWTQEDLIQDIIDQYERHLYFLNVVRTT